jgi:hypothetical protein
VVFIDATRSERVKDAYWATLDEALDPEDAERRMRDLVTNLEHEYPTAAGSLAPLVCGSLAPPNADEHHQS